MHHEIDVAVARIIAVPRAVENLDLEGVRLKTCEGRHFLQVEDGTPAVYNEKKLADVSANAIHPIILGVIRGRTLVMDGAHRLAAWRLAGHPTGLAVRLTEQETTSCMRRGMASRVASMSLDPPC